jgi:hypothetical protein
MITEEKRAYNRQYHLEHLEEQHENQKKYREENAETIKQRQKEYYETNKDTLRTQQEEYGTRPEVKKRIRERNLARNGWSPELYDLKYAEQNGKCEICKIPTAPRTKLGNRLVGDHEHTTPPKPRGLLCVRCNSAIGLFLDNPIILVSALMYLIKYGVEKETPADGTNQ